MLGTQGRSSLALALLAATFLTPPAPARAAPGDALGGEFQVNTFTTQHQRQAAVAMDADGDFVVVWQGAGPGDSYGVFAQRFDAAGVAQGPEFQVNSFTTNYQLSPAVAMDADGDFVVTWTDTSGQDGDASGVFAQRFDAAGMAQGTEFRVNTVTTAFQIFPAVAMDADGDFVVAWTDTSGQDGYASGVFAQRFDAAGMAQGTQFQVNSYTTGDQYEPVIAMDADGDFVVAWRSDLQDGSFGGIFAQRFDAIGAPQGPEFQVNTATTGFQVYASVAMDADGDFVVAWQSYIDGIPYGDPFDDWNISAQRYDAAGVAQGAEFQVNSFTTSSQVSPAVAMDADGDFVVAWTSVGQDGSYGDIFARRYDAAGVPEGPEVQVNSFTTLDQTEPAVAMDADGDFVVAWESQGQDGEWYGVFAQRFDGVQRVAGDFDGDGNADFLWRNVTTGNTVVWLMDGTERLAAQPIGAPPLVWQVAGTGDFDGDGKADVLWRHTGNGSAVIWRMDGATRLASVPIGGPPLVWVVEQVRDTDGDGNADILWRNSATANTVVWRMSAFTKVATGSPGALGADWQVQ